MVMATPLTDTSETNHNFKERRFFVESETKGKPFFRVGEQKTGFETETGVCFRLARRFSCLQIALLEVIL